MKIKTKLKNIILILFVCPLFGMHDGNWVKVEQPERAVHQWHEEDRTVWVVFSKVFGADHVLIRFPEDPTVRKVDDHIVVSTTHLGLGEFSLTVQKASEPLSSHFNGEISYFDHDLGHWIYEKHIVTNENVYLLRLVHPTQSQTLFRQFVDSIEIDF